MDNEQNQMPAGGKKSLAPAILGIAVLLAVVGYILAKQGSKDEAELTPTPTASEEPSASPAPSGSPTAAPEASLPAQTSVKTFTVTGTTFSFSPAQIKVKKGDIVKIIFVNQNGFHDWSIDEFNAKTSQIAAGQSATIQFTADKTGTFEYYCSVGDHRARGMKGSLVVE